MSTFAPKRSRYCVVVPVLNEGERFRNQLRAMAALPIPDVLIVDGGSTDGSNDEEFLASCGVRALIVKTGEGRLGTQLRLAFAFALNDGYDGVITIDGNGKDGPDAISQFVDLLDEGYDFIQGSRFVNGGVEEATPFARRIAIRYLHAPVISRIAGQRFTDTTNGFRGFSRRYLTHPQVQPLRATFVSYELLAYLSVRAPQLGLLCTETPVRRSYPARGRTPTKLPPVTGNLELLRILWQVSRRRFDPT